MKRLDAKYKWYMGGFLSGFGFYTTVFFLGYFWRVKQILGR
ncbi:MAG: hypothetical protein NWE89_15310 [Candidatus Bathyarchaeota archaeon]|nr:hypothetical protein [Candidatus Bathyarchaeota archaeon]